MGKNQHVVHVRGKWGVKGEGNTKITVILPSKDAAIKKGVGIAKNQKSELVIHNKDGKVVDTKNYSSISIPVASFDGIDKLRTGKKPKRRR